MLCAFVGATLAWYCWGLAFLAPLGPSSNIIHPELARRSHRLAPGSFYALQAGRLVGAPLLGHVGDRYGRRTAFALALLVVGLATTTMGCFYPLRHNGEGHGSGVRAAWAVLRFFVGVGVAGQYAGASLIPMESCASEKAGAMAAAVGHAGLPVGLALAATVACIGDNASSFPEGLRLAQLANVVLLPVALWAYAGEDESWPFEEMEEAGETLRWPLLAVLKCRPWVLLGGAMAILLEAFVMCVAVYYWPILLPKAIGHGGLQVQACLALALLTTAGFTLVGGFLRDRVAPRCVIFRIGVVIATAGLWAWFRLARLHKPGPILSGDMILLGPGLGLMHGSMTALVIEPFFTPIAYTGSGLLYQITNAVVHIAYPSLAYWLLDLSETCDIEALQVAPGINAIGHVVTALILCAVALVAVRCLIYHGLPYVGCYV